MNGRIPTPRTLDATQRDVFVASLYQQGVPVAEIADRAEVCVETVRNIARRFAEARIFSKRIVRALGRHGIVPRKTATMELSDEAADKAAAWLGILDGDGSVGIYRNGREPRVRFAGTRRLMEQCETFWRRSVGFDGPTPAARPHRRGIWVFALFNYKARSAAQTLLGSSPVSMQRKRELLADVAAWTGSRRLCLVETPSIVSSERRH